MLVVDDDPNIRFLLTTYLSRMGCVTREAADGREALAAIPTFEPEVMILDLSMPHVDGFGVLEEMRRQGLTERIKVLVLSARSQREEVGVAMSLGARDYMAKPFDEKHLVLRMARLLIRSPASLR